MAADQQVEFLVGAAQFDVGFQRHRVVALQQGIEELVDGDGQAFLVALGEVVALQHAGHGVLGGEPHQALGPQLVEPARIEIDGGLVRVEDLEHLLLVGLGVLLHLLAGQRLAGFILAGRVADHAGEVPDQEDCLVSCLLVGTQFV